MERRPGTGSHQVARLEILHGLQGCRRVIDFCWGSFSITAALGTSGLKVLLQQDLKSSVVHTRASSYATSKT